MEPRKFGASDSENADMKALEVAQRLFSKDCASQSFGMELVSVRLGMAEVRMTVQADMVNGHGDCHGGLIFTLADSAFAFACNSNGEPTVAAGATIDFLAPARVGQVLSATARELWRGKRTGLYDIVVRGPNARIVAQCRGRAHQLAPTRGSPS